MLNTGEATFGCWWATGILQCRIPQSPMHCRGSFLGTRHSKQYGFQVISQWWLVQQTVLPSCSDFLHCSTLTVLSPSTHLWGSDPPLPSQNSVTAWLSGGEQTTSAEDEDKNEDEGNSSPSCRDARTPVLQTQRAPSRGGKSRDVTSGLSLSKSHLSPNSCCFTGKREASRGV